MAYCGVHKTYEEFNSAMLGISAEVASIGVEVAKAGEDPWKKREYKNQQPPKREGMVNDDYMSHRLKEKEASGESEEDGGGQSNDNEDI
jgi:predicted alpha/beta-hydrolase family hydrolase